MQDYKVSDPSKACIFSKTYNKAILVPITIKTSRKRADER